MLRKETTLVSLWVNPLQLNTPLLLLINALTLGKSDLRTRDGYSKLWKLTGPSMMPSGAMRTGANFSCAFLRAGNLSGRDGPSASWDCVFCLLALGLFRCATANGIAQTARSRRR